jgi:hypothetical protein
MLEKGMKKDNDDVFTDTIIGEIIEIHHTGEYIDGDHAALSAEILIGALTLFEKEAYTLYQRDILVHRELLSELVRLEKSGKNTGEADLACKVLAEKIKMVNKLFTFHVRNRLNLWNGSIIAVRKGFQLVEVKVYWTKEVKNLKSLGDRKK